MTQEIDRLYLPFYQQITPYRNVHNKLATKSNDKQRHSCTYYEFKRHVPWKHQKIAAYSKEY